MLETIMAGWITKVLQGSCINLFQFRRTLLRPSSAHHTCIPCAVLPHPLPPPPPSLIFISLFISNLSVSSSLPYYANFSFFYGHQFYNIYPTLRDHCEGGSKSKQVTEIISMASVYASADRSWKGGGGRWGESICLFMYDEWGRRLGRRPAR